MGRSGFSPKSRSPGNLNRGSAVARRVLDLLKCLDDRIHTIRREENTEKQKRKMSFCFSGYRTGPGKVLKTNQRHRACGFLQLPPWTPCSAPNSLASSIPGLLLYERHQLGTLPRPGPVLTGRRHQRQTSRFKPTGPAAWICCLAESHKGTSKPSLGWSGRAEQVSVGAP